MVILEPVYTLGKIPLHTMMQTVAIPLIALIFVLASTRCLLPISEQRVVVQAEKKQQGLNKISPGCKWRFVDYTPSPYEKHWVDNIDDLQTKVCEESNKQTREISTWTDNFSSKHPPSDVFSFFTFQNECTGETSVDYIEPLAGLTRSPLFCLRGQDHLVSKDYLVVSWNVSNKLQGDETTGYRPKAYYFDLGASTFNSGAGGASQSWMVEMYEARGVRWDGIFAWEMKPHAPSEVWGSIPDRLKPIYHWYNIPVNPGPGHGDNALEYVRQIAHPEDFVLMKLDIDSTPIEEAIIDQILTDSDNLIDELYFEHHVHTPPMFPYWGVLPDSTTLKDTYRIFSTLRNKGVMAHAWV